jgi:hypothetical protein
MDKILELLIQTGELDTFASPPTSTPQPKVAAEPLATSLMFVDGCGAIKSDAYVAVVKHYLGSAPQVPKPTVESILLEALTAPIVSLQSNVEIRLFKTEESLSKLLILWEPETATSGGEEFPYSLPDEADAKVKQLSILLLNVNSVQLASIKRDFPLLRISMSDGRLPGGVDYDLVIGFTKFMSHSLDAAAIAKYKSRYLRISGAASGAKSLISKWLVDNNQERLAA